MSLEFLSKWLNKVEFFFETISSKHHFISLFDFRTFRTLKKIKYEYNYDLNESARDTRQDINLCAADFLQADSEFELKLCKKKQSEVYRY